MGARRELHGLDQAGSPLVRSRRTSAPPIRALVDAIKKRRKGKLINLDRMLLHSPPFAQGWNALLGAVRSDLSLDPQVRELSICAVARLNEAPYEWYQHAPEYLQAGGTQARLDGLEDVEAASRNTKLYDEVARAALRLTMEMTRAIKVSNATFDEARRLLGNRGLAELVGTIATYNMVSRFLVALGVDENGE